MRFSIAFLYLLIVMLAAVTVETLKIRRVDIGDITDCKILNSDDKIRTIECKENEIIKMQVKDWPEEWNDKKEVGEIVKFIVIEKGYVIPLASCEKRAKARLKEYENRGMGQMQRPTNLPVDKDCQ